MHYYCITVDLSSWKAEKLEETEGDVTICSRKSVDNFIKGSLKLMVEPRQHNLSMVLLRMHEKGFIKNQNIMAKSSYTNNLEISYLFSCQKLSVVKTESRLECGNQVYDEGKTVIVDGVHYHVEMRGEIKCIELNRDEAEILYNNNPYMNIGTFTEPSKSVVKKKE
ncbi:TPA_asm: M [Scutellaria alphacytorhabdovirus 1]|nr:TPA_asm: M [Scutellaria alphacytorhabdovirus 1]